MTAHKRKSIRDIQSFKSADSALVCLTSYTAPIARLADHHADLILVGDSLGMVLYGFPSTLSVTLDMMILHGRAVVNATQKALVVVDMPFGSYQESPEQAFRNAARVMAETGCGGVKLEGGAEMAQTIAFLTQRGIPVMGHTGLQPQSVHSAGGYRVMGRSDAEKSRIVSDSQAIADAGVFAMVLECIDPELAAVITKRVSVPTVGIGASAACDGQILVAEDLLGLGAETPPKFVKQYESISSTIDSAFSRYAAEVRSRNFPDSAHIYAAKPSKTA